MYRIKLFIFILVMPLLLANQCSTAVKHAGIRTVSSPFLALKGIYSALTPDKYEQLVEEEEESSSELSLEALSLSCESQELENDSATDSLYLTAKTIDSKLCSACVPWARVSEPEPFCSPLCNNACEKVCPQKGLKILDRYKEKVLPYSKDKLSFRNSSKMFHDADSALIPFQGYCSGMVSSRRKFNMNGFFEANSRPTDKNGKVISRDDPKLVDYYQEIIENIHDNIPTEIPGYANLGEFTQDPMIQDIMRQEIADEWADVSVLRSAGNSTAIFNPLTGSDRPGVEKADKVISGLKEKIKNVGSATLYMGLGGNFNMHIVDAFDVIEFKDEKSSYKARICINDPNYAGINKSRGHSLKYRNGELTNCSPSVLVDKKGGMSYIGYKLVHAEVDHSQDEAAVTKSVERLKSFCKSKKSPPCGV